MRVFKTVKEIEVKLREIKEGVASDTMFSASAITFIARKVDELVKMERKRILSDATVFLAYKIRFEDLSLMEALRQWQDMLKKVETVPEETEGGANAKT